ncbi:hypothetical protein BSK52_03445 [Paenibacillus odorifer]|uniref:Uncharacterized protein n=2 Tax=Paenibacillus odorifer TaxID=189426 RepID=A0A1R0Y7Y7_9BACL|nr:hypothetical protein BSK52_03445 [Paenibacillus odorifer]
MAEFINELNSKKASLAIEIARTPSVKLKEMLDRIYAGEQPSKQPEIQCYAYPNCPFSTNLNCQSCYLAIPRAAALQSISDEISLKIGKLINETNFPNLLRDMSVLTSLMDRLTEAKTDLGKEFVEGYIDLEQLKFDYNIVIERMERHTQYYLEEK